MFKDANSSKLQFIKPFFKLSFCNSKSVETADSSRYFSTWPLCSCGGDAFILGISENVG
jgi:hypothetical protein